MLARHFEVKHHECFEYLEIIFNINLNRTEIIVIFYYKCTKQKNFNKPFFS